MIAELRDVGVFYQRRGWVLRNRSLTVEAGARLALVGPSGSGKTTILSLLGRALYPTEGSVEAPTRPNVRYMLQANPVFPRRTVSDNVMIGTSHLLSRPKARLRAEAQLVNVGLDKRADDLAGNLSGGELQRLCIARALVGDPLLLLADEPTGQLDAALSREVAQLLLNANSECAVVVATHDLDVAAMFPVVLKAPF